MNKIAIIGHQDSGHIRVEDLLHRCGMKKANLSRRDQLSACEITHSICRAMRAPEVHDPYGCKDFHQIRPSTVWDGLVLDLMLGNLDQDLWGWADSQALLLMDYLAEVDDNLTFVLVYDSPGSVLLKRPEEPAGASDDHIYDQLLDHWAAYNSELLRFFLRHRTRSILVHVDGVTHAVEKTLSMLQARLSAPLQAPEAGMPGERFPDESLLQQSMRVLDTDQMLGGALVESGHATDDAVSGFLAQDAESFLIGSYLNGHPASRQLYEELQGASNLPFEIGKNTRPSPESAWKAFLNQRWFIGQLLANIHGKNSQLEHENRKLSDDQKRYEAELVSTRDHLSGRESRISALEQELKAQTAALQASQSSVGELDSKLASLGQELQARNTALEDAGRLATERDARIADLEQELGTQAAALETARNAIQDRDDRLSALGQELQARNTALEDAGKLANERDARIADLEQELETQAADFEASRNAVQDRDGRLAALGQELQARNTVLEDAGRLATERDARIADLEQELGTQAAALETARNAVQDRDARLAAIGQELQAKNTALEEAGKLATERDARIADLEQELEIQATALQDNAAVIQELGGNLFRLEEELKQVRLAHASFVDQLKADAHDSDSKLQLLSENIRIIMQQNAQLARNLYLVNRENGKLISDKRSAQEEANRFEMDCGSLREQLQQIREELQRVLEDNRSWKEENGRLKLTVGQISCLKQELQAKEADLDEYANAIQEYKIRISEMAMDMRTKKSALDVATAAVMERDGQLTVLMEKSQLLADHIQISSRQNTNLAIRLHELEKELDALRNENTGLISDHRLIEELAENSREECESLSKRLHETREELESLYLENRQLKQPPVQPPAPTGADERVKAHLSYRIGRLIIQESRNPMRWMCLPFSIIAERKRFLEDRNNKSAVKPPPIHEYADADNACRIKAQLSYRLGDLIVRSFRSKIKWMALPVTIPLCVHAFHKDKSRSSKTP